MAHLPRNRYWLPCLAAAGTLAAYAPDAAACGCFAPPDPTVPVVQAGERILFAMENGEVIAHIQIAYQGSAAEFGWLLPLPAVPTLELGTDELFNTLTNQTQPKYRLQRVFEGSCGGFGFSSRSAGAPSSSCANCDSLDGDSAGGSPLVIKASIGPYDYAVLRADNRTVMFNWLTTNRYFIPVGTEDAVGPYIRPGAYFLALKLRSGNSAGDLQPVVVRYASDLPMIPIVLTSVAAAPDMGIQVWMLGKGRAIPRNYYHTVINDAVIDWNGGGQNYNDVIIRATKEAPERHTLVTEFAGSSQIMRNLLNAPGRFGSLDALRSMPGADPFLRYLYDNGYGTANPQAQFGSGLATFSSQLVAILERYIPVPGALANKGVTAQAFYDGVYFGQYRLQDYAASINYQPAAMTQEIDQRVVQPTLAAGRLFDAYPYLTRLYTTLSPEDMSKDPVFSFNPELRDWPNVHNGTLTYHCGLFADGNLQTTPATLRTESGWSIYYPSGVGSGPSVDLSTVPASQRIEILREEGAPELFAGKEQQIRDSLKIGGCGCANAGGAGGVLAAVFSGIVLGLRARRRAA